MKGFAGEVCFGGHRAPGALDHLAAGLASLGGQTGRWEAGPFGVIADVVTLRRPEDGAQIVTAAAVRLDARPALVEQLGLSPAEGEATADSALLARAFLRWGPDLADHVLGDWVCVVWDTATERLWLGRDAAGNTGLFYWHNGNRLVFSTSLPALLAHPWVPIRPNPRRIARQLAVVFDRHDRTSTVYDGIITLPGGHDASASHGAVEVREWWRPETLSPWAGGSDDEYLARFLDIYRQAVVDRLDSASGRVGIMLSGGLDSGSVAALAAPVARERGTSLRPYTSVPALTPDGASGARDGDETAIAGATVGHLGLSDDWTLVRCESESIVASLEEIQRVHARPLHGAAHYYWNAGILRQASRDGVRAILTGQGGNFTVSWQGLVGLKAEVRDWRTWFRSLRQPAPGLENPRQSPIQASWAQSLALAYPRSRPRDMRLFREDMRLCRLGSASLGTFWMELAAAHDMAVGDPTRDRRVVESCWRLPERLFRDRGTIRRPFRSLLPDVVLNSRRRGLQSADLGHRLAAEKEEVSALIDRLSRHPLVGTCLDFDVLRRVLAELSQGVTPESTRSAAVVLVRGLDAGLFLSRF